MHTKRPIPWLKASILLLFLVSTGRLDPPVLDIQRITERFHPLVVRRIPGDKSQSVLQGDGGNHGVCAPNRLPRALKISKDSSGQLSASLIQGQYLHLDNALKELLNAFLAANLMQPFDNLHDRDG